jgi:hypothetical protein
MLEGKKKHAPWAQGGMHGVEHWPMLEGKKKHAPWAQGGMHGLYVERER